MQRISSTTIIKGPWCKRPARARMFVKPLLVQPAGMPCAADEGVPSTSDEGVPPAADESGAPSATALLALSLACDERGTSPESPKCIIDCQPADPLARKPHAAYHKEMIPQRKATDDAGESQLPRGRETAESLARRAVQSLTHHELLAQSTQYAAKQDWRRAARACRDAIALAPDEPVAYAALGAVFLNSKLYAEAAQWYLGAKERYPEGSEEWAVATANAFHLLRRQTECDEVLAKPHWWNDEGLKALSTKVVRAAPADVAANRMRAYVLSGRCAAWVAGPRSSAEFKEAGTHFEQAAAGVRLERLLQRCRPSSSKARYRPRYPKACSPAHQVSLVPSPRHQRPHPTGGGSTSDSPSDSE